MISKVVAKSVANLMGAVPKVMSGRGGPAGVPVTYPGRGFLLVT